MSKKMIMIKGRNIGKTYVQRRESELYMGGWNLVDAFPGLGAKVKPCQTCGTTCMKFITRGTWIKGFCLNCGFNSMPKQTSQAAFDNWNKKKGLDGRRT